MKHPQSAEKGQALVEMCAGIIGMLSVFIGILVVSGLCLSNIKTLKSSKVNAETAVLNATDSYLIERRDIYAWTYGDSNIPFTAADQPLYNAIESEGLIDDYLSNSYYSAQSGYTFKPLNDIPLRTNYSPEANLFTGFFDNYATAASLVYGPPDSFDKLYSYRSQPAEERRALQRAAASWLGIDVARLNLSTQRTNQAYMPNFGRYLPQQVLPVNTGDDD
jgi:hypothetical protein